MADPEIGTRVTIVKGPHAGQAGTVVPDTQPWPHDQPLVMVRTDSGKRVWVYGRECQTSKP